MIEEASKTDFGSRRGCSRLSFAALPSTHPSISVPRVNVPILVFDVGPERTRGVTLHHLLRAEPELRVRYEAVHEPFTIATRFSQALSLWDPDAAFIVCSNVPLMPLAQSLKIPVSASGKTLPVIFVVDECEPQEVIHLLNSGATDYLSGPLERAGILPRLCRSLRFNISESEDACCLKQRLGLSAFVGESPVLVAEIKKIPAVASHEVSVLILGESGTGKELCARAIHCLSPRAAHPFVSVNCGAIPTELVENELFGHEAGAFTGAATSSTGVIEEANGGTLFLDEVDSLPPAAQVKLLRFLQEKEYRRLGASKNCQANLRVLAASNCCLTDGLQRGKFRNDLYFRLNTISLTLPPLRDRVGDIALLAAHFLAKCCTKFKKIGMVLSRGALQKFTPTTGPAMFANWKTSSRVQLSCPMPQ